MQKLDQVAGVLDTELRTTGFVDYMISLCLTTPMSFTSPAQGIQAMNTIVLSTRSELPLLVKMYLQSVPRTMLNSEVDRLMS